MKGKSDTAVDIEPTVNAGALSRDANSTKQRGEERDLCMQLRTKNHECTVPSKIIIFICDFLICS